MDVLESLVDGVHAGRPRDIGRLITLVENGSPIVAEVMSSLTPASPGARVIGITGAPGVGKSTTTSTLVSHLRAQGSRVAVLAVDPSSPFSGGALLGDRIRMNAHATDHDVFIRSMASRGHLGGLAATTPQAVRVLDAAKFDVVLIETVGVGQSEVEVAASADSTVVLLAPGMGDGIQAAKAGILEVADVLVVNKSDRDGAAATLRELRGMVALAERSPNAWTPPIVKAVALRDEGTEALLGALEDHRQWLAATGALADRRIRRARAEVEALAVGSFRARLHSSTASLDFLAGEVARGELDPHTAARRLTAKLEG